MNRSLFLKKIEEIDPKKEVVSIDLDNGLITYSNDIIQHRFINKITGDEELVRAFFVAKLVNILGYDKNNIELEKEYEAGRPKKIKPRIDILVKDKRRKKERTFLFVEVKAPDKFEHDKEYIRSQLFELGKLEDKKSPINYLVYCSADVELNNITEKNVIIDYLNYPDYYEWEEKGKLSLDELPKDYGEPRKVKFIRGVRELDTKVPKSKFDLIRKDLHDVLWGGGGTNYNEVFVNLVKIFLAKIYDENNTGDEKPYTFQIEYKGKTPETSSEVFTKINILYLDACKNYLGYGEDELRNEDLNEKTISANKVRYVVEQLQGISLTRNDINNNDVLGDFFESIVTEGFKQDKGQFFTHVNLVKFIIYSLGIDDFSINHINKYKSLPFIIDPACGSGTFLINAMKEITYNIKRKRISEISTSKDVQLFIQYKMPNIKENTWAWDYLYGIEHNPDLALSTKVNMVLHGDGSGNIFAKDALLPFGRYENRVKVSVLASSKIVHNYYDKELNEQFDFVISNPPFSIKLDNETKKTLPRTFIYASVGSSENLFIERWYQLLKENGKLGVVLPESIFDTAENQYIRIFLYKYFKIISVISLPSGKDGAFLPYTPIKTSLLFAQKKTRTEVLEWEKAWINSSNEYAKLKRRIKKISETRDDSKENKEIIKRYLKTYLGDDDKGLNVSELLEKHKEDIKEIDKNLEWWVFEEISKMFNYSIFVAHTKNIGYHRTKNREFKRENDLFIVDDKNYVSYDIDKPRTILDYIKGQKNINKPDKFYIKLSDISKSISLRFDHRFHRYKLFEEPHILLSYKKIPFLLREAILEIRNGKDVEREAYSVAANGAIIETDYKYITINNIKEDGFIIDDIINLISRRGEELRKYQLENNEVIITRSGTVGISKVFNMQNEEIIYIPSGYLIIVKVDENKIEPEFLEYFLNSKVMKLYFDIFGTGKTQKNISQQDIKRIPVPSLSREEQKQIIKNYRDALDRSKKIIMTKEREIEQIKNKLENVIQSRVLKEKINIEIEEL